MDILITGVSQLKVFSVLTEINAGYESRRELASASHKLLYDFEPVRG